MGVALEIGDFQGIKNNDYPEPCHKPHISHKNSVISFEQYYNHQKSLRPAVESFANSALKILWQRNG